MKFDLSTLFKGASPRAETAVEQATETIVEPTVAAVVVAKAVSLEAATAQVAAAGFDVSNVSEQEDGYVFTQGDHVDGDVSLMKTGDHVGVAMVNVSKDFWSFEYGNTSFAEAMAQQGLIPGVCMGVEVLHSVLMSCMDAARNPGEAAELMSRATQDFQAYLTNLVSVVPAMAFKADLIKFDDTMLVKADEPAAEEAPVEEPATPAEQDETAAEEPVVEEPTEPETPVVEEPVEGDEPTETVEKADTPAAPTDFAAFMEQVQGLIQGVTEQVTTGFAGVNKSVEDLNGRIDSVENLAKSAEAAAKGVIPTPAPGERMPVDKSDKVQKADSAPIDTAYRRPD